MDAFADRDDLIVVLSDRRLQIIAAGSPQNILDLTDQRLSPLAVRGRFLAGLFEQKLLLLDRFGRPRQNAQRLPRQIR